MLRLIIGFIVLAIILLAAWYIHKHWVELKSGKGWLGTILKPFFWVWDKLFG